MNDLSIMKTHKLFINGAFPRSESGRTLNLKAQKANSLPTWLVLVKKTPEKLCWPHEVDFKNGQ